MKNNSPTAASRDFAITLLHVVGMVMILLCHMLQAEKIYSLSEIFISGVPLFLFISGYLAGTKKVTDFRSWFLKKVKRVWLPLAVFAIIVYGTFSLTAVYPVTPMQWLFTLLNIQGLNYTYWKFDLFYAVPGCGHFWFVTTLAFCYLLTPLMQKFKDVSVSGWRKALLVVGVLAAQLGLLFLGFQPHYILTFFFGYFLGGRVRTDGKWYCFVTVLTVLSLSVRLLARNYADSSMIYDRYITLISQAVIAVWIFYTIYFLKEKLPKLFNALDCKAVHFTEHISFYFYLVHYIFLDSPIAMFNYFENRILAYLAVIVCSYVSAVLLYLLVEKVLLPLLDKPLVKQGSYKNKSET